MDQDEPQQSQNLKVKMSWSRKPTGLELKMESLDIESLHKSVTRWISPASQAAATLPSNIGTAQAKATRPLQCQRVLTLHPASLRNCRQRGHHMVEG